MEVSMNGKVTKVLAAIIAVICFCVMCFPMSTFAANKLPAPDMVKIVTDREGPAGSGIRVFAKYKSVKGAEGYQIKVTQKHDSHPATTTKTFKKNTKKTKKLLTEGYDFIEVKIKVRACKMENGEKVYGEWSNTKTKKW